MPKVPTHTIRIPPLGPLDTANTICLDTAQTPAVYAALLDLGQHSLDLETVGRKYADYYRVHEALYHIATGNTNAVLRFLKLILNIQPDPTSAPRFFEALWRMSCSSAWKAKGIDDILAYVAGAVHREEKRLARQRQTEGMPSDAEMVPADDMLPAPAQTQAAQELLDHLRYLSTPRQRQILDLLDQGYDRTAAARILNIKPANLRRHLSDLRKNIL